jgi:hypothetical protein
MVWALKPESTRDFSMMVGRLSKMAWKSKVPIREEDEAP